MKILPRRNESVMWRKEEDGGVLVYSTDSESFMVMNEAAALIWLSSDGLHTWNAISEKICQEYGCKNEEKFLRDLQLLLEKMHDAGLIEY